MFEVTPQAQEWITKQLDQANAPDEVVLRMVVEEEKISLMLGKPQPGDKTFEAEGKTYLAVEPEAAEKLSGKSLTCQQTQQGEILAVAAA